MKIEMWNKSKKNLPLLFTKIKFIKLWNSKLKHDSSLSNQILTWSDLTRIFTNASKFKIFYTWFCLDWFRSFFLGLLMLNNLSSSLLFRCNLSISSALILALARPMSAELAVSWLPPPWHTWRPKNMTALAVKNNLLISNLPSALDFDMITVHNIFEAVSQFLTLFLYFL